MLPVHGVYLPRDLNHFALRQGAEGLLAFRCTASEGDSLRLRSWGRRLRALELGRVLKRQSGGVRFTWATMAVPILVAETFVVLLGFLGRPVGVGSERPSAPHVATALADLAAGVTRAFPTAGATRVPKQ